MKIEGMITAMVTPFHKDYTIHEEATKKLVEKLIADGVNGIFILGTNGEFQSLSEKEKVAFARLVVKIVNKRVAVYAGVGSCGTKLSIDLANQMKEVGVDAVSVIAPYFQKLSDEALLLHYKTIAQQVDLPILIYNIPSLTNNPISLAVVKELSEIENIKGIKDSSGDFENMRGYIEATKDKDFVVLAGSDSLILKALQAGAKGAVAATSNLLTKIDVAIYQNYLKNDFEAAKKAQDDIETLRSVNKLKIQPVVLKHALKLSGYDVGEARLPLLPVSADDDIKIKEMLAYYKDQL